MLIIEFLGHHGEVLKAVKPPVLCQRISIREDGDADLRREHFPERASFPKWRGQTVNEPSEIT